VIRRRFVSCIDDLVANLDAHGIDDLRLYPFLAQPVDVCTDAAFRSLSIRDRIFPVFSQHRFDDWSMLHGRIRTRGAFVAGITVRIPDHDYAEEERAMLSTLTELASLALF
jgi:hypothetical protein